MRKFLEKAEKPIFFFDDDPDGLTSYVLLKKHYKKGVGICMKSSPTVEGVYAAAIKNHKPDLVVILDRPNVSQEVIDFISVPIVWLDHHKPIERDGNHLHYYNPMNGKKPDNRPTSYWAYKIVEENEWIAVIGIIGDWNVPEEDILEKFDYRDLLGNAKTAPEMMFDTEYGTLVKVLSFAIKGSTKSTKECFDALVEINSPLDILEQRTAEGKLIYKKFEKLNKEYEALVEDAMSSKESGNVYVYTYPGGKNSYTGNLSNELLHRLDNDVIIVGREKDEEVRMSIRSQGKDILPVLNKALENVEGYGGGHAKACGAAVKMIDFPKFVEIMKEEYKKA